MKIDAIGEHGFTICADATAPQLIDMVPGITGGPVPLILTDPPYGNILPADWDRYDGPAEGFAQWMLSWTRDWAKLLLPNAAFYVWGGIGTPDFRPFFKYLSKVEEETTLKIANLVTWKKKRAYGVKHNYLFTREELVYLFNGTDIKKPRCFNIPLLEEKRGYSGYNAKYPAKSEYYRRTNVWTDVTEMMRGKVYDAQKAQRVIEIPIEIHTAPGEWIIDPFAGSGTAALAAIKLGRRFLMIEKDETVYEMMVSRLKASLVDGAEQEVGSQHDPAAEEQEPRTRSNDHARDAATHRKRTRPSAAGKPGDLGLPARVLHGTEAQFVGSEGSSRGPDAAPQREEVEAREEGEDGSSSDDGNEGS